MSRNISVDKDNNVDIIIACLHLALGYVCLSSITITSFLPTLQRRFLPLMKILSLCISFFACRCEEGNCSWQMYFSFHFFLTDLACQPVILLSAHNLDTACHPWVFSILPSSDALSRWSCFLSTHFILLLSPTANFLVVCIMVKTHRTSHFISPDFFFFLILFALFKYSFLMILMPFSTSYSRLVPSTRSSPCVILLSGHILILLPLLAHSSCLLPSADFPLGWC